MNIKKIMMIKKSTATTFSKITLNSKKINEIKNQIIVGFFFVKK